MASDFDFTIDCLRFEIHNAAGYEHRIQPIALRAAEILAAELGQQYAGARSKRYSRRDAVSAPSVNLDLSRTSDEQAANLIARGWLATLALHLEV